MKIFHDLAKQKIKEGIFVGPQIRELLRDDKFDSLLRCKEKKTWEAFKYMETEFLENSKEYDCDT